jgi:hypothetical protein
MTDWFHPLNPHWPAASRHACLLAFTTVAMKDFTPGVLDCIISRVGDEDLFPLINVPGGDYAHPHALVLLVVSRRLKYQG